MHRARGYIGALWMSFCSRQCSYFNCFTLTQALSPGPALCGLWFARLSSSIGRKLFSRITASCAQATYCIGTLLFSSSNCYTIHSACLSIWSSRRAQRFSCLMCSGSEKGTDVLANGECWTLHGGNNKQWGESGWLLIHSCASPCSVV